MPIYEYQCIKPSCGYIVTEIENYNLCSVMKQCPKCGGPMHKIMSAPGNIIIK